MSIWIVVWVIAAIAVTVPIAAVILVSFASLSEEAAQSLGKQAPGLAERAARRLLAYRTDRISPGRPGRPSGARSGRRPARAALAEVRFDHASRSLSDPREYAAGREPRPGTVRPRERAGAGV
jgi:hypothetical protein